METLAIGDRIKATNKQHPAFPGQAGEIMSAYVYPDKDVSYKVRFDNGPICVILHQNVEVI